MTFILSFFPDDNPSSRQLRVGDKILYWPAINVCGDPYQRVCTTVTGITDDAEYPLALFSGDVLPMTTKVKKVVQGYEDSPVRNKAAKELDDHSVDVDPMAPVYT